MTFDGVKIENLVIVAAQFRRAFYERLKHFAANNFKSHYIDSLMESFSFSQFSCFNNKGEETERKISEMFLLARE